MCRALKSSPSSYPRIEPVPFAQKVFCKEGNEVIEEDKIVYAESDLFNVFTLPMIEGNAAGSLT